MSKKLEMYQNIRVNLMSQLQSHKQLVAITLHTQVITELNRVNCKPIYSSTTKEICM